MRIGIIVATKTEQKPFFEIFGSPTLCTTEEDGYEVNMWHLNEQKSIFMILSGIGEIAAASSTQYLIDNFYIDKIFNYGVVGGLNRQYTERCVGIVDKVVHYDFDITFGTNYKVGEYPKKGVYLTPERSAIPSCIAEQFASFTCASADKIVSGGEPKKRLHQEFGADICEMEAAGILITCNRNHIPCTLIKAISDGVDGDIEAFDRNVHIASKNCVAVLAKLI